MKQLITISDLTREDVYEIFDLAKKIKKDPERFQTTLKGKTIGLIFEKPSTRTWVSFEVGVCSLGGSAIYLGPHDIALGVREEIRDVARVLNRYWAGAVLRTYKQQTIAEFQKYFQHPVINGLSDAGHPCQSLSDFFTVYERFPKASQPLIAFVGDGNNVLHSHMLLAATLGAKLHFATPKKHEPLKSVLEEALSMAKTTGAQIRGFHDPIQAVQGADVVYTDVWVSMGQEKMRKNKLKAFKGMQVNTSLMSHAKKDAVVMHCLPAHRGEEITEEVIEGKNSIVFDQAENRLHIQKAILLKLYAASERKQL